MKYLYITVLLSILTQAEVALTSNQVQARLNIVNGASAECVMPQFYTNNSWTQIKGEIGRNGIGGLYYKVKK